MTVCRYFHQCEELVAVWTYDHICSQEKGYIKYQCPRKTARHRRMPREWRLRKK